MENDGTDGLLVTQEQAVPKAPPIDRSAKRAYDFEYYRKNKQRKTLYNRTYYTDQQDKILEAKRKVFAENRDKILARNRAFYRRNRNTILATKSRYGKNNRDKMNDLRAIREARKQNAFVEKISRALVFKRDRGICGECYKFVDSSNWHLDHVIPLARGGEHRYSNVQVTHPVCNLKKGVAC